MVTKPVNSGSSLDSRSLDTLWEMSQDVSIEEIRLACIDARRNVFSSKGEDAKTWREWMDNLFTIFLERKQS